MPVRNGDRFIREAVASTLGQSWTDFELLVVDNGSTDGTAAAVAGFSDPRVVRLSEPRPGVARALQAGLVACRGDLVGFCAHDDVMLPGRLAAQVEALDRTGAGFSTCNVLLTDASGTPWQVARYELLSPALALQRLLRGRVFCAGGVVIAWRHLLDGWSFDPELVIGEDTDMLGVLAASARAHVGLPLYAYRRHGGSLTDKTPAGSDTSRRMDERVATKLLARYGWRRLFPEIVADERLGPAAPFVALAFIGYAMAQRGLGGLANDHVRQALTEPHAAVLARALVAAHNGKPQPVMADVDRLCQSAGAAADWAVAGLCHARAGDASTAFRCVERALAQNPEHWSALELLDEIAVAAHQRRAKDA